MIRNKLLSLALTAIVFAPAVALAQDAKKQDDDALPTEDDIGPADDTGAPAGSEENPDAPTDSPFGDKRAVAEAKAEATAPDSAEYPIEEVRRPITLPRFMAEVAVDYPISFDPFTAGGALRGYFGITREAQLGVAYGFGTATEDGYEVGKGAALDFTYLITDWVAAELTLPMLFDPFALGATVSAPMKFTFLDKLSLLVGEEFFSFKIAKFIPSVDNSALNTALTVAEDLNTELPDATLRPGVRVVYQAKPNVAVDARARMTYLFPDEDTTQRNAFNLEAGVMYSVSRMFDFGVRMGWSDLAEFKTFGTTVAAALRI